MNIVLSATRSWVSTVAFHAAGFPYETETHFKFETNGTLEVAGIAYAVQRIHDSSEDCVRLIALGPDESSVELYISPKAETLEARAALHEAHPDYFPALVAREDTPDYTAGVFALGAGGQTLVKALATARSNRAINDCADLCEAVVLPILKVLASLHGADLALSVHNPAEIWLGENRHVLFLDCPLISKVHKSDENRVNPSFSPPGSLRSLRRQTRLKSRRLLCRHGTLSMLTAFLCHQRLGWCMIVCRHPLCFTQEFILN